MKMRRGMDTTRTRGEYIPFCINRYQIHVACKQTFVHLLSNVVQSVIGS
jgi:hypothetical protein